MVVGLGGMKEPSPTLPSPPFPPPTPYPPIILNSQEIHLIPLVSEKLRQDGPTVGIFNGNLLMIQTLGSLVVGEGREGEEGV